MPGGLVGAIVTNPPYCLALEFIQKALRDVPVSAWLLRTNFLESVGRLSFFRAHPPARIWISSRRLPMMHRHGWTGPRAASNHCFAWFVWDDCAKRTGQLGWFDWKGVRRMTGQAPESAPEPATGKCAACGDPCPEGRKFCTSLDCAERRADAAEPPVEPKAKPNGAAVAQSGNSKPAWSAGAKKLFDKRDALMLRMDRQYFISSHGGQVKIVRYADEHGRLVDLDFFSFGDFKSWLAHRKILIPSLDKEGNEIVAEWGLGEYWLAEHAGDEQRRRLIGCFPEGAPNDVWNTWRGFEVKPKPGDWSKMRDHIFEVLAAGDQPCDYILKWCAWLVQNPAQRAEVVLTLRGEKGSGKGTLGTALAHITAPHSWHVADSAQFLGRFNEHLRDTVFLFADEAFWAGDVQAEGKLKYLITEPELAVEGKFKPLGRARNMMHILIASNADWVVPVKGRERRFMVFDVSDYRVGDKAWFSAIYAQLSDGGYEAMLHDLGALDLSGWHPREIFVTDAMREQKAHSDGPVEATLREVLQRGWLPAAGQELAPNECHKKGLVEMVDYKPGQQRRTETQLGMIMRRKFGATSHEHKIGGVRVAWWALPNLPEARQLFDLQERWAEEHPEWWEGYRSAGTFPGTD